MRVKVFSDGKTVGDHKDAAHGQPEPFPFPFNEIEIYKNNPQTLHGNGSGWP